MILQFKWTDNLYTKHFVSVNFLQRIEQDLSWIPFTDQCNNCYANISILK